ncbi:MAG: hypothetical protein AAGC56_10600 [Pseudomonadota bacterium]
MTFQDENNPGCGKPPARLRQVGAWVALAGFCAALTPPSLHAGGERTAICSGSEIIYVVIEFSDDEAPDDPSDGAPCHGPCMYGRKVKLRT